MKKLPAIEDWEINDAVAAVIGPLDDALGSKGLERRRDFVVKRDHWRDGDEWPGSIVDPILRNMVLAVVKAQHTVVDTISEGLDNSEAGLFTTEPAIVVEPLDMPEAAGDADDAERKRVNAERERMKAEAREVLGALSEWWDAVDLWEHVAHAWRDGLWSTRGVTRLRVPNGVMTKTDVVEDNVKRTEQRLPDAGSLVEALEKIRVSSPDPDTATLYEDPDTLQRVGVLLYKEGELQRAQLCIEQSDGSVVIRVLGQGIDATDYSLPVPVLSIHELRAPLLVTDAILAQQNRENFGESSLLRQTETASYAERHVGNAQEPKIWLPTPAADGRLLESRTDRGVVYHAHPVPVQIGAGVTTFHVGFKFGKDGEHLTTPHVQRFEPVNPIPTIEACQHYRRTILQGFKQRHLAGVSTAEASGVAYQQDRSVFEAWLKRFKGRVERMIRMMLRDAVRIAEAMTGESEATSILTRFRITVNLTVNAGPVLPDYLRALIDLRKAGLRSLQTALAESGLEDTSSELELLESEEGSRLAVAEMVAKVYVLISQQQNSDAAARFLAVAGIGSEYAEALKRQDTDGALPVEPPE